MAEVNTGDGGGGGKHGKKGRKKGGNPRVDMTPMVDLAFLLLTFFVLTSNLNKAKTMELAVPKDRQDTSIHNKINFKLANTVLIDGNKDGVIYLYEGKLDDNPPPALQELKLDPKDKNSFRAFVSEKNSKVSADMKELRKIYKTGHLDANDVAALQEILKRKAQPNGLDDSTAAKRKIHDFDSAMVRLKIDAGRGEMSDTTYRYCSANIRNDDQAPFFIIKWGADAHYGDVINVMDELRIADATKYALVKISPVELQSLSAKTGRKYKDLPPPDAAPAPGGH